MKSGVTPLHSISGKINKSTKKRPQKCPERGEAFDCLRSTSDVFDWLRSTSDYLIDLNYYRVGRICQYPRGRNNHRKHSGMPCELDLTARKSVTIFRVI